MSRISPSFESSVSPVYGDGSDGDIVRSTNGNENGVLTTTSYTLESGVTRDVTDGVLVVVATDGIVIEGTIDASGAVVGGGGTGGGSSGSGGDGGDGGGGGGVVLLAAPSVSGTGSILVNGEDGVNGVDGTSGDASGAGQVGDDGTLGFIRGGGTGGNGEQRGPGDDGSGPGGGGGGGGCASDSDIGEDGGSNSVDITGGAVGALKVSHLSPVYQKVYTLAVGGGGAAGAGGGGAGTNTQYDGGAGGGGGGGGGCGGLIAVVTGSIGSFTTDVSAGVGGVGGSPYGDGYAGGDGADGNAGLYVEVNP